MGAPSSPPSRRPRAGIALPVPAALALAGLLSVLLVSPPPALAAEPSFGTPTAEASFGRSVEVRQPVSGLGPLRRAEVLLWFADGAIPSVRTVSTPAPGSTLLRFALDLRADHLLPNTPITARWRLTGEDGESWLGPPVRVVYADDRFRWQSRSGRLVRVHWVEGDAAFGARALRIAEEAVAAAEALFGVREERPIDFFIYPDEDSFYDALGPGTRENVGGQANAEIRTLFAQIGPGLLDSAWVGVVIPHELTHLVFDTAVRNPYHFPPRWLNEGLAVYLSEGYGPDDRAAVTAAVRDGSLFPLAGLTAQFPTRREAFFLAYAESVSAVDFLVRRFGRDALVALVRAYAGGVTDDEAFSTALGLDLATFEAAWLADLGAPAPTRYGPRPAPAGPIPEAWRTPGAGQPEPSPTELPTPTGRPPAAGEGSEAPDLGVVLFGAVALVVGAGVAVGLARRRRARDGAGAGRSTPGGTAGG